jgi:hypothetical protein
MDKELKQHLEAMEARLVSKDDLGRLASKDDLERFASKDDLERFASKDDLERVETALLTEFHKWASPAELRAKSNALATRALDQEMELLKERVEKLEGKKAS